MMKHPNVLKIRSIDSISTEITVPGDKSISHRAVIIAGLSNGPCRIRNFLPSEDCLRTLKAMQALGANFEYIETNEYGPVELLIKGRRMQLKEPSGAIDCGNSGTAMRLLAGILAAQPFKSTLVGDESLSSRPMDRVIKPLEEMGAKITAQGELKGCAPLEFEGGELKPLRYVLPVASAQVKSAILLAALFAEGKTTVVQPAETRDHTERMLANFRVRTVQEDNAITIYGGQQPEAVDLDIPGDISSAAFWIVAAAAMPKSKLLIQDVGLNPTRAALLPVLLRMGAKIKDVVRTSDEDGEPAGNLEVQGGALRGTELREEEIPNLIDEIPVLVVAGALAQGRMVIRNAGELRVKETDRISAVVENLRAMGGEVTEYDDGVRVVGGQRLRGARVDSFGDHRIAMAFAVAGLFAEGETIIENAECIATSYPGFLRDLDLIRNKKPKR